MGAALATAYQPSPEDPEKPSGGSMPFLEHLDELRKRILRSCVAIGSGTLVAFLFVERIFRFVFAPAMRMLPAGSKLIYTQPGEAFSLYIDLALIAGGLLSAPFVMYQVWMFVAPGLYAKEKKLVVPFVVLTTLGAVAGAAFSHYLLFPSMIVFFGTFSSSDLTFLPRVEDVFDLYVKMLLGMVAVFQIPTIVFFLARMRLVTARFLWRHVKYAILLIFIVAAVLTPSTDPWNQTVFAAPMIVLYLLSIVIARAVAPRAGA
jgi:sec-independent protein translocase protein TatC